jgi:DNA polymerase III delta prime subunit
VRLSGLSDKERQIRGMDAIGLALAPLVDERMTAAVHGKPWVALYEAKESHRRGHPYRVDPRDSRVLLRILRHERGVFTEVDTSQRAWIDELVQASNRAAHSPAVSARDADRALDTMSLLSESLDLSEALDTITSLRAQAGAVPDDVGPASAQTTSTMPAAQAPTTMTAVATVTAEPTTTPALDGTRVPLDEAAPRGLRVLSARVGDLDVVVRVREAINYALVHNGISPIAGVMIRHRGIEPVRDVRLELVIDSPLPDAPLAAPLVVQVGDVQPDANIDVPHARLSWRLTSSPFVSFDEAVSTDVHLTVTTRAGRFSDRTAVRLLTVDEWWAVGLPETLAAFVRPNEPSVQRVLDKARDLLAQRTGSPALEGYQTGPERVHQIAEAIYDALADVGIRYTEAPPSFEGTGQRIRSHTQVLDERHGTCLDLAVLYAAALEQAGIHPVVALTDNHALAGYLTEDSQLPDVAVTQRGALATIFDSDLFEAVETTSFCSSEQPTTFDEARGRARTWRTRDLDQVNYLLDVHAAHRIVKPLPNIRVEGNVRVVEVVKEAPAVPARRLPSSGESTAPATGITPARIERWRRALLDMTYLNPLLKLKKASSVPVHVPTSTLAELEDLVANGTRFSLVPHDDLAHLHRAQGARNAGDVDAEALRKILIEENRLFTATNRVEYHRKLRGLARKAKTALEETGTDSLYLTLGTLEWTESGKEGRAPLFLVPVKLVGGRGLTTFTLALDETRQVEPNYCLVEKLRVSWGLNVPELSDPGEDESGIDLVGALAAIRSALLRKGLVDFHVEETAYLALLQFSTLEMWRDLTEHWPSFMTRPAVQHLVETPGQPFLDPVDAPEPDNAAEAVAYLPIPADGSQIEAVRWAAAGKSFILEGPPGTGKSQTITNLIAHLLAEGKKVLFVAEKQAALDVVKSRLDQVGLGQFSLDVHGKTQTVKAVREQLAKAMDLRAQGSSSWETARAQYRGLVDSLSSYPQLLHEPGPVDMSAWEARQVVLELRETTGDVEAIPVPRELVMGGTPLHEVYGVGRDLGAALGQLGVTPSRTPWRLAGPVDPEELDRAGVASALDRLAAADDAVTGPVRDLTDHAQTAEEVEAIARWVESLRAGVGRSTAEARDIVTAPWRKKANDVHVAIAGFRELQAPRLGPFSPQVLALDLNALSSRSDEADRKLLGKTKRRRSILTDLAPVLPGGEQSLPLKKVSEALGLALAVREELGRLTDFVRTLPGVEVPYGWNPLDPAQAGAIDFAIAGLEDAHRLWAALGSGRAEQEQLRSMTDTTTRHIVDTVEPAVVTRGALVHELGAAWSSFLALLASTPADLDLWRGGRPRGVAMAEALTAWESDASGHAFIRLQRWLGVRTALERLGALGLNEAVRRVRADTLPGADAESAVRLGVADAILAERLESTGLEAFDDVDRSRLIGRFVATGEDVRQRMLSELPAQIVQARSIDTNQPRGKVAELRAQLARRRGGLSIRQLLQQFGPLITQVTPCFLMSPTSVARFLPSDAVDFDVVVFDEASQIRVPEAIGAMGRGKAVVIVGDSQQMPPTSAFAGTRTDDDDEESAEDAQVVPRDLESILTEGVESRLPRLLLSWHYRSRDETLIAFSNKSYYEGRLSSFPTPPDRSGIGAIELRRVDGQWEGGSRGAARVNRVEAHAVVQEIKALLVEDPDRSIGVVTFNTQQRDLILDSLEAERMNERSVEAAMSRAEEPLFVKNLENVQGDERDVILFTLAFAKDARGRVPLNWGPLSRSGGEKRLNVAVTRAKERVVIFASFSPHELDLSGSTSRGLAYLKDYLLLAQHGVERAGLQRATARDWHLTEIESDLRAAGLEVRTAVGLSDFTVDLAVRAADDRPWVAVLLDGPAWAQRTSVGDRDGLPRAVLTKQMGWSRVERVWLPTWLRDSELVVKQVVEAAQTAQEPPARVVREAAETVVQAAADLLASATGRSLSSVSDGAAIGDVAVHATMTTAGPELDGNAVVQFAGTAPTADVAATLPDDVSPFLPANAEPKHERWILDDTGARLRDLVRAEIEAIVTEEGPIVVDRLLKVVAGRFDLSKLHTNRKEQLRGYLPRGMVMIAPNGDRVAWPAGTDPETYRGYRVPTPGGQRELSEVPYEELRNALVRIIRAAHSIGEEDALRDTAREFGIFRVAAKVRERLTRTVEAAAKEGKITRRGPYLEAD